MRHLSRTLSWSLIFGLLSMAAWAAGWTQGEKGHWSHDTGISLDVPGDMAPSPDPESGGLMLKDATHASFVAFFPCPTQKAAEEMAGALGTNLRQQYGGLDLKDRKEGDIAGGHLAMATGDAKTDSGVPLEVSVGDVAGANTKHLVFFCIIPKASVEAIDPAMTKMMGSIRFQ